MSHEQIFEKYQQFTKHPDKDWMGRRSKCSTLMGALVSQEIGIHEWFQFNPEVVFKGGSWNALKGMVKWFTWKYIL